MSGLPTGTVTFLFTDIEGSTQLWENHPEAMKSALAKHDSLLGDIFRIHNGQIIKTTGDGFHVVFETATDAVQAAIHSQQALQKDTWDEATIKVRMGLHTGEAELRDGDYFGQTLNLAARIMSVGHGGQILLSETTYQVAKEHLPGNVSALDLGQHRLKGVAQPRKIIQISTPDIQQDFPALRSISPETNNLPTQLTSFVGRERELAEAKSRLEAARLLTLIGPGGTGKTRLSIQLGSQLVHDFKDGVWLIEFAPISDPSLILQTIASVFDIGEVPGMHLKTLLHDFLREKQLLLILDNCEHLVEASAKVVDELLHVAPNLKIISSSREALGINGETVYRVPSLSLPNQYEVTKEAAMGWESVQLFVERASAANPKFQLADGNASSVAQICSRLDGIPLAIELAASRITVFSPEQIARRLDDRFKLLTGGSRTALPRQQTLRALIDWSYDLLSEGERALLRRLSVFAGGWTFEAAETICNNLDVFEHLPQLVNKSLVTVNDEGNERRYFLLETIRKYAREKLLEKDEGEGTRNRHLAYYLEMAETAGPQLRKREHELEWIYRLETEFDNIRTAIEWGLSKDVIAATRMIVPLAQLLIVTTSASEGHRWGTAALKQLDSLIENGQSPTDEYLAHKARLLASMSILSFSMGDTKRSGEEAQEAIPLLRSIGERWIMAAAMAFLTAASFQTGNIDVAIATSNDMQTLAEELDDPYIWGVVFGVASTIEAFVYKDFTKANTLRAKTEEIMKVHGSRWSYGITMYSSGSFYIMQKQFDKAREKLSIAMQAMQEIGSRRNVIMIKSDLAHASRHEGNYHQAIPAYQETIKEWQRMGHRAAVAHQLECLAFIAKALEQAEKATKLLGAAEALRQKIEMDMNPFEREEYEKEVSDLKANMDGKEFASLWAEGRSMTMDEAIELALS
jgi:predicted ATPase/class 3 adenylate cyclase